MWSVPNHTSSLCRAQICRSRTRNPFQGGIAGMQIGNLAHTSTVHCRRRKIRCLVAPDDAEGRCENCIRLRKDCQFFPVDQQPPIEKKSRPNSRLETPSTERSNTTPIASSPTNLVPDPAESYYPYQTMPMNTSSAQELSPYNVNMVATNPMGLTPGRFASYVALSHSMLLPGQVVN
jgi:hypothetical protein